jgi:hypothetical protein
VALLYNKQNETNPSYGGTFVSRIIDTTTPQEWSSLAWKTPYPIGKSMPDMVSASIPTELSADYASLTTEDLADELKALFHFDGTPGATIAAATVLTNSVSTAHGTISGAGTAYSSGKLNSGIYMNGTPQLVFDHSATGLTETSMSIWIKPATVAAQDIFTWCLNTSSGSPFVRLSKSASNTLVLKNGTTTIVTDPTVLSTTSWTHIGVTIETSGADKIWKLYVNGILAGTSSAAANNTNQSTANKIYLARNSGSPAFSGNIDEFAVWNRKLVANEMQQLYQRGISNIKFQMRSCALADCSGSAWIGPDGTDLSYFSELYNSNAPGATPYTGQFLATAPLHNFANYTAPSNARYFQYKVFLESFSSNPIHWPEVKSVSIGPNHYPSSSPWISGNLGQSSVTDLTEFISDETPAPTTANCVTYNIGSGADWYYWKTATSSWEINVAGTTTNSNSSSDISSFIATFPGPAANVYFKAFLNSDGSDPCTLESVTLKGH